MPLHKIVARESVTFFSSLPREPSGALGSLLLLRPLTPQPPLALALEFADLGPPPPPLEIESESGAITGGGKMIVGGAIVRPKQSQASPASAQGSCVWNTYHTAEGHAYLYNPATGESKWADAAASGPIPTAMATNAAPSSRSSSAAARSSNPYVMAVPPSSIGAPYFVVNGIGCGVSPYAGTSHYAISANNNSSGSYSQPQYAADDMEGAGWNNDDANDELDRAYATQMAGHRRQIATKSGSLDIGLLTQLAFSTAARIFTTSVDRAIRAARLFVSRQTRNFDSLPTTKFAGTRRAPTHGARPWGQVESTLP
jgi:hypothetical protein